MSNTDKKKLAGFRASIAQHIEKFNSYPDERDKEFALKTIFRDQGHIRDVLKKHAHWESNPLDSWSPPKNWREKCKFP